MSALDNSDLIKYQRTGGHGGLGVKMPHLSTVHLKYNYKVLKNERNEKFQHSEPEI